MNKLKIIVVLLACISVSGCVEDFPEEIEAIEQPDPPIVHPPCSYQDSVFTTNTRGMDGRVRIDVDKGSSYTKITCDPFGSNTELFLRYYSSEGLKSLKSQMIDYGIQKNHPLRMFVDIPGPWDPAEPYGGKLYVIVNDDNTITFTWCNILLRHGQSNLTSRGGIIVPIE
jgi:hypothetical protein